MNPKDKSIVIHIFHLAIALLVLPALDAKSILKHQLEDSSGTGENEELYDFSLMTEDPSGSSYRDALDINVNLLEADTNRFDALESQTSHASSRNYTPVVFWHGMGDSAFGSVNIDRLALQRRYPGMSVFSVQVGNSVLEDVLGGYFVNVNYQIEQVCNRILQCDKIKEHGSFNAVGFSQGAQFMRGLIQRCPFETHGIRVKNFISLGGQHQGVFGLPNCRLSNFCNHVREILSKAAYEEDVQKHLVQAEYWHDPDRELDYRAKSDFLADINNENNINETYRSNLIKLSNIVLVEFTEDEMVVPRESSLFGFYDGNNTSIVPLEDSRIYREDRLGLKQINEQNRLKMIKIPGHHLQYKMSWFLTEIASVYLDN